MIYCDGFFDLDHASLFYMYTHAFEILSQMMNALSFVLDQHDIAEE